MSFSAEYPLPPAQAALLRRPVEGNCLLSLSFGRHMDRALWRAAWSQLVQTHPILRTALAGSLLQEVAWSEDLALLPFPWQEPDWREVVPEEIPARWQELQASESSALFDPAVAPLWRVHFLHLPGDASHLLLTLHPALCDEPAAAQLLIEWLMHYEAIDEGAKRPACAGVAAANGSVDFGEGTPLPELPTIWQNLDPESACPADSLAWSGEVATVPLEHSVTLPAEFVPAVQQQAERLAATPSEIISLLWAAYWAGRSYAEESLTLVPVDLRPFLAPEHRDVLGHLTAPTPWRLTLAPRPELPWWEAALTSLREAHALVFSPWMDSLAEFARAEGIATVDHVPGVLIRWSESQLNDRLHTALPRWLAADARWIEPAAAALELRLLAVRSARAELRVAPGWLPAAVAKQLPTDFVQWSQEFLENRFPLVTGTPYPQPGGFSLVAEPSLAERLEACLVSRENLPLAEYGDTHLTVGEMAAFSNQLLRYLRKNRPPEGTRFLVCLQPGFYASLTALTLVRENWDAVWIEPGMQDADAAAWAESLQAGCLLLDSATQEGWPVEQLRHLILDTEWEKIAAQPTSAPSARKRQRPAQWEFLSKSGARHQFGEAALGVSLRTLLQEWFIPEEARENGTDPSVRLLASGTAGHPWLLEEILVATFGGAVLIWREAELFSTRSAFQEHLTAGKITHLLLPAARFADWVHFLVELRHHLPETLRWVALRAGHLGQRVLSSWADLVGDTVRTQHYYAPLGLAGLSLAGELPIERWARGGRIPPGLLPMGQPQGGLVATVRNRSGGVLPTGCLGEIVWELPDDALTDGILPRELRPDLTAVEIDEGFYWGFPAADFSRADWTKAPRRIRAAAEKHLLAHPHLFDGFTLVTQPPAESHQTHGSLVAWLVPLDSGSNLPENLRHFLSEGLPTGWKLDHAVALPKWPVFADGSMDRASLPQPVLLPQKVEKSLPAVRQNPQPMGTNAPAPVLEPPVVDFLSAPQADKPLLVVCGELLFPGTEKALLQEAGASWSVATMSRWDHEAWLVLRGTPCREVTLLAAGAAVWEVVRWAGKKGDAGASPGFLFLHPAWENTAESVSGKLRGWWDRLRKSPAEGNTRREGIATPRPVPLQGPARIVTEETPSNRLQSFFPDGEFFEGDLSSAEAVVGAIFDILRDEVEADAKADAKVDEEAAVEVAGLEENASMSSAKATDK